MFHTIILYIYNKTDEDSGNKMSFCSLYYQDGESISLRLHRRVESSKLYQKLVLLLKRLFFETTNYYNKLQGNIVSMQL